MYARTKASAGDLLLRSDVPFWALTHLGQPVTLKQSFGALPAGSTAILDGVTHMSDGTNRALLVPRLDDPGYLEDVPFACLQPPGLPSDHVLDLPGRLGQVAFMWAHGLELRKLFSKNTFYRYRRELLAYSIDICRPFVATKRTGATR